MYRSREWISERIRRIGIGTAIAEAGLSVRYTTAALVNELAEAATAKRLSSVIARYSKVDCTLIRIGTEPYRFQATEAEHRAAR